MPDIDKLYIKAFFDELDNIVTGSKRFYPTTIERTEYQFVFKMAYQQDEVTILAQVILVEKNNFNILIQWSDTESPKPGKINWWPTKGGCPRIRKAINSFCNLIRTYENKFHYARLSREQEILTKEFKPPKGVTIRFADDRYIIDLGSRILNKSQIEKILEILKS